MMMDVSLIEKLLDLIDDFEKWVGRKITYKEQLLISSLATEYDYKWLRLAMEMAGKSFDLNYHEHMDHVLALLRTWDRDDNMYTDGDYELISMEFYKTESDN